jgi:hypothetical protein
MASLYISPNMQMVFIGLCKNFQIKKVWLATNGVYTCIYGAASGHMCSGSLLLVTS